MTVHVIFAMKLDAGITCKAIIFPYGHKLDTPPYKKYAYFVSMYSVIIVLLFATLNGLDVQCADVQND